MPLKKITINSTYDILNLIQQLILLKPDQGSHAEIIRSAARELVVTEDGDTVLLADLNDADALYDKTLFPTKNHTKLTVAQARANPELLIYNTPVAETLHNIAYPLEEAIHPLHFRLPNNSVNNPLLLPAINLRQESEEGYSLIGDVYPNNLLQQLLWLRFINDEENTYDYDRLESELNQIKTTLLGYQTLEKEKLNRLETSQQSFHIQLEKYPELQGKNNEALQQIRKDNEKIIHKWEKRGGAVLLSIGAAGIVASLGVMATLVIFVSPAFSLLSPFVAAALLSPAWIPVLRFPKVERKIFSSQIKPAEDALKRLDDFRVLSVYANDCNEPIAKARKEINTLESRLSILDNWKKTQLVKQKVEWVKPARLSESKAALYQGKQEELTVPDTKSNEHITQLSNN